MTQPEISILVPALNEAQNIDATLETITSVMRQIDLKSYEVVVVDDGSDDATGEIVAATAEDDGAIRLIRHPVTRGLGAVVRTGIETVRAEKFMIVPGDNDVSAEFIENMVRNRDLADLVIAAPLNLEMRPYFRVVLSLLYRLIYYTSFNVYVFYVNAPSIWLVRRVREVEPKSNRFSIVSEINTKLLRAGTTFAEVPGYFSGGKPGGAPNFRNLIEVVRIFLRLNWEIHVSRRARYSRRPERVYARFSTVKSDD